MLEYQRCRQDSILASFVVYATKRSRTKLQIFISSVLDMKLWTFSNCRHWKQKAKLISFSCVMCYYPLCGSIQLLQAFPIRCKYLIYESTLKPPSHLSFWLNIIWYDTSKLKNRVSVPYYGLLLATLAAHSFQIVQDVLYFYFLRISGKCERSIYCSTFSLKQANRSDPKKSLHFLEMLNVLLWANRNEYFITCYY